MWFTAFGRRVVSYRPPNPTLRTMPKKRDTGVLPPAVQEAPVKRLALTRKRDTEALPAQEASIKRLSLNLPAELHTRFKTACSATNRRMMTELTQLVERRTEELEVEAGLTGWARDVRRERD